MEIGLKQRIVDREWLQGLIERGVDVARDFVPQSVRHQVPVGVRKAIVDFLRQERAEWLYTGGSADERLWDEYPRSSLNRRVLQLEERLWGGYSQSALLELRGLAEAPLARPDHRAKACYILARWEAGQKQYTDAISFLRMSQELDPGRQRFARHTMLEAQLLCLVEKPEEARVLLESGRGGGFDTSLELTLANTWNSDLAAQPDPFAGTRAIDHINNVFKRFGLSEIALSDPHKPLSIDNIKGVDYAEIVEPDQAVTVIVPLFNSEATIETALRSIAEQSWRTLEVIVVDDCSTDRGCAVAEAFAARDPRFSLIRKSENSGSYVSRNVALESVRTPYVTIHDADDWSHPQKIEVQMRAMTSGSQPYNYTMLSRATTGLAFVNGPKFYSQLVGPNHSSGVFRTADLRHLGGWDVSRISADTELFWRVEAMRGGISDHSRDRRLLMGCPLSFGRHLHDSLTQIGATHTLTMFHGVRREYREAAAFWHKSLDSSLKIRSGPFFPAPSLIRPGGSSATAHDLFLIGDFNAGGFGSRNAFAMAVAAVKGSLNLAIMNYPSYFSDVTRELSHDVRRFAWDNNVRIVAPGEKVDSQLTLIAQGFLLHHALDRFPSLETAEKLVVIDRLACTDVGLRDVAPLMANAKELLGDSVRYAPVSDTASSLLEPLLGQELVAPLRPIIPTGTGARDNQPAVRSRRLGPVIGVFAPDVASAGLWDPSAFLSTYCGGSPWRVNFFGPMAPMSRSVGRLPRNWRAVPGAVSLDEFFAEIDLFLYFPHPQAEDLTVYPALHAIAAGVPVIAAPRFRADLEDAAQYCDADQLHDQLTMILADARLRAQLVESGQSLIRRKHGVTSFTQSLSAWITSARAEKEGTG